jgi:putative endonuclease
MAEHNEIGKIGEGVAKTFLMKHGFSVIQTNYFTHYGELDLIAKKDKNLRFVEVKSIKVRDFNNLDKLAVTPQDNLTRSKWSKLVVSIETYLKHKNYPLNTKWQVDLACVYVNTATREGRVVLMENIHI